VRNLVRGRRAGVDRDEITGHKTRSVFDRDDITSEEDRREAVRLLSAHLAAGNGKIVGKAA